MTSDQPHHAIVTPPPIPFARDPAQGCILTNTGVRTNLPTTLTVWCFAHACACLAGVLSQLIHFATVIVLWCEVASLQRGEMVPEIVKQPGDLDAPNEPQPQPDHRRWEITGDIDIDEQPYDLPDGYNNQDGDAWTPSAELGAALPDRARFQQWKPPNRPDLGAQGRYSMYFPHSCGHQHHRRFALVGVLLACVCLLLGVAIVLTTTADFDTFSGSFHLGSITIKQPSPNPRMVVYIGMGTMGYNKNGQTAVITNPASVDVCGVLRTEDFTPALDPHNCVDAAGCSFCTDAVQWFKALFGIAFFALLVNAVGSVYRVPSTWA